MAVRWLDSLLISTLIIFGVGGTNNHVVVTIIVLGVIGGRVEDSTETVGGALGNERLEG